MSLFATGTGATASSTPNTTGDISKDVQLASPPEDSISELAFSPTADFLSVASWDNKVRIYQVNDQGQSEGKAAMDFQAPVLTCAWSLVCPRTSCSLTELTDLGWIKSCWSWS